MKEAQNLTTHKVSCEQQGARELKKEGSKKSFWFVPELAACAW